MVRRITPRGPNGIWVYVTVGAWEATEDDPEGHGTEFFILSPLETPEHVETLAMVANFHADPCYEDLAFGGILEIGRPWVEDSSLDHLLISLPYPYGPEFEI